MSSSRFPIPQGTLDMLILQILSLEPAHGYGIAQRAEMESPRRKAGRLATPWCLNFTRSRGPL